LHTHTAHKRLALGNIDLAQVEVAGVAADDVYSGPSRLQLQFVVPGAARQTCVKSNTYLEEPGSYLHNRLGDMCMR